MKVFICGITGNQGSALARLLLPSIPVVGLTRSPSSAPSLALISLGAELHTGSYTTPGVLAAALADCTALFLNPVPSMTDPSSELRDGRAILAAAAHITHIVHSTALGVDNATHAPDTLVAKMLHEKHLVEDAVRAAAVPSWTILRPGNFMANYVGAAAAARQQELVQTGVSTSALTRDTLLPLVDVATIAAFARAALLDPARFHAQEIALADELLTLDDVLAKLGAAAGRKMRADYLAEDEVAARRATDFMVDMQFLMRGLARFVDVDKVKSWGVPTSSFDAFLEREAALVKETYGAAGGSA
ncbi:NAD dependent epimerase/dehydratase, putative [Cordyceps militaris CM01]|uniref:NAD dependent epimerase/dehydratase, putative n=1 Tax=Cordyceps militaris (strain CM01) TaxID=983644 RepID=G3JTN4_CORMM|nr:NAD dependent epimerase/dehydratase, putative [Cordyceps militaris CM01]EGX88038.1 NAD dependent epimerase/dehydratase, putative [Cordyceps militaris CM01]